MKPRFQIAAIVVAFVAGIVTHAIWPTSTVVSKSETKDAKRPEILDKTTAIRPASDQLSRELSPALGSHESRTLRLRLEVVEAILSGGRLKRMLLRMGLADAQVEAVSAIQADGTAALKRIEKEHSKFVSDDRGDYVAISAFPAERGKWLDGMEADLRDLLGDDRAAVIARMIAFAENDEDVGVHRRELFVTEAEPTKDGDRLRIEERTFNEQGQHVDSDFELVNPRSQSRWGHLLDFGNE